MRNLNDMMTVEDLIIYLQDYPKDAIVMFTYPSGDYWKTTLAKPITRVEEKYVEYSNYHSEYSIKDEPNYDDDNDENDYDISSVIRVVSLK